MPQTITKEAHDHRIEAQGTVDQRVVSKNVGSGTRGAALDDNGRYVPSPEATVRQRARMNVNVPAPLKDMLAPVFRDRTGQATIMGVAETLHTDPTDPSGYVFHWLAREPREKGARHCMISFSPTDELMSRARYLCLSPHILVRAAAVKVALTLTLTLDPVDVAQ